MSSHTPQPSKDEDPASVITCDMTGLVNQYAGGAQQIFQYTSTEVVGKMSVAQFHPAENVPTLVPRLLKTAVDTGRFQEEVTLVKKDGTRFKAVLTVRPMFREGTQVGFMGYTRPL
jgi:PAS domain S-box-containing protein